MIYIVEDITLEKFIDAIKELDLEKEAEEKEINSNINVEGKEDNIKLIQLKNELEELQNEFNNAKNINNDLCNVLKTKECALMQIQQELCMANETLSRLEKAFEINF